MYPLLNEFMNALPSMQPQTHRAIYPRRVHPPNGYANPRFYAAALWSQLRVGFEPEMNMLPHVTGIINCLMQIKYRVPTYFVRSEFAQAVAQTEPPGDFKFSEILWPLPAMLFVLPTDFVLKYFGFMCPFISVANNPPGVYPKMLLKDLPPIDKMVINGIARPVSVITPIGNEVERITVIYPCYSKNRVPVDYTGSYPLTMNVNEIASAPFTDATYMEEQKLDLRFDPHENMEDLPKEGEQERELQNKVMTFATKLMLALTARPNVIKLGPCERPEKIKKGRIKEALWHPNLIGWEYRAVRVHPEGGGTHASPRMHWRKGHWRNQPYGPKPWTETSPKRLAWIEPILVNSEYETGKTTDPTN